MITTRNRTDFLEFKTILDTLLTQLYTYSKLMDRLVEHYIKKYSFVPQKDLNRFSHYPFKVVQVLNLIKSIKENCDRFDPSSVGDKSKLCH